MNEHEAAEFKSEQSSCCARSHYKYKDDSVDKTALPTSTLGDVVKKNKKVKVPFHSKNSNQAFKKVGVSALITTG